MLVRDGNYVDRRKHGMDLRTGTIVFTILDRKTRRKGDADVDRKVLSCSSLHSASQKKRKKQKKEGKILSMALR